MAIAAAGSGGLSRFLRPGGRAQLSELSTAITWGVAAGAGALWLVQPFDWLKKQFLEKPEPEK